MRNFYLLFGLVIATYATAWAGNPDRQGEAGAYELLLNPFARSAGLSSMSTANVAGAEAMRINMAGIGRVSGLEVVASNMQYLVGTDINMNALGFAAELGNGQAIGVTLAALSFGDIPLTTTLDPEGTGSTFSPTFFHVAIGYSKTFEEKISVGVGVRFINEAIFNASATGFAIDAGVQYVSGERDEFKLGISLRNVGLGMRFSGDGITEQFREPGGDYDLSANQRVAEFELPFQLNIGSSYDVQVDDDNLIVLLGNFTSNAFSRDRVGAGLEYSFRKIATLRGGYNYELDQSDEEPESTLETGVSAGISLALPFSKPNDLGRRRYFVFDYAYRPTRVFDGIHNLGLRVQI